MVRLCKYTHLFWISKSAPSCIKCLILEHGLHMHFRFRKRKAQQLNQLEEIVIKLVSGGGPLATLWIYILFYYAPVEPGEVEML
jgi:hypothetical protein